MEQQIQPHSVGPSADGIAPRRLAAGQGWRWIAAGFELFRAGPLPLAGMAVLWFLIVVALNLVPFLGSLAATVLSPILFGGFMLACDKLRRRLPVTVGDLFAAFSRAGGPLALVGVLYLLGLFLVSVLTALLAIALGLPVAEPAAGPADGTALATTLGLSLLLSIPLVMAFWYAPALVTLGGQPPATAMRLSFRGALANLPAFLLFLATSLLLSVVAAIPLLLGFLIWGPVVLAAAYAGYRDIFTPADEPLAAASGQPAPG